MRIKSLPRSQVGILVIVAAILMNGNLYAQSLLPLPGRATTELLTNPGFEVNLDGDKIPDGWTGKNTTLVKSDKVKCDKPGKPVAYSGSCAFMFRGNSVPVKGKIQQKLADTSALVNGTEVTFSVYLDARSAVPDTTFGKAKIVYSDGTSTKFQLNIPAAAPRSVADYLQISNTQAVSIPVGGSIKKVKVDFRYKEVSGKFLIDDASFSIVTVESTATATTPEITTTGTASTATPTGELTASATTTPITPTGTHTLTPSITFTPSNTHTPTWTHTPTNTPTWTHTPTNTP